MAYIGKSPDGTGVRSRFYYTQSSGGGTSVTGSSDDGTSLAFSDGAYVDVYLNGVLLVAGTDYNTTTANTIAGLAALANGDVVEVVVYDIFTVADTVSALNGGTFSGAVGFSGGITGDVAFDTNTLKVDSSNNRVGIGTAPDRDLHVKGATGDPVHLKLEGDPADYARIMFDDGTDDNIGEIRYHFGDENLRFTVNAAERFRITADGDVGIGTTSPVSNSGFGGLTLNGDNGSIFSLKDSDTEVARVVGSATEMSFQYGTSSVLTFKDGLSGGQERLRLDSSGNFLIGVTSNGLNDVGSQFSNDGFLRLVRDGNRILELHRKSNDGELMRFTQGGTEEGSISVSGSSVNFNGGHLSRWSRLVDGSKPSTLVKGTVMSNLDDMIVWSHDAVAATVYEDGDLLPEGKKIGDVKTPAVDAFDEDNDQLNHTKVSDTEGDVNVAGVFTAWDDEDDYKDFYLGMTGDMVIRIAKDTTVARGDLLMSAGDGTAKPQDDDIVRSKTIAKVTSTTVSHTYDDGSYLVPCVLMAC